MPWSPTYRACGPSPRRHARVRPGAVASPNRGLGLEKWKKLAFFGDEPAKTRKLAKSPKRRAREASKALKQPAMGTKAQQALASQRETMKRESVRARSQRRADEAEARFEQRKLRRKQKHRGH